MKSMTSKIHPGAAKSAMRHVRKALWGHIRQLQREADDAFSRDFPGFVAAVEAGLRHEETILEALGYRCLHERRAENAMILCALHRVAPSVEQGSVKAGRQIAAALGDALALHRLADCPALADGPAASRLRRRAARLRCMAFPKRLRHLRHLRQRP